MSKMYKKIDPLTDEPFLATRKNQVFGPRISKMIEDCNTSIDIAKRIKDYVIQTRHNGVCAICGRHVNSDSAVLHHKNINNKQHDMSKLFMEHKWNLINEEDAKTILLCPTCHAELHKRHKETGIDNAYISGTEKTKTGKSIAKVSNGSTVTYMSISEAARMNGINECKIRYSLRKTGEYVIDNKTKFIML